jgi:hypothetical protein
MRNGSRELWLQDSSAPPDGQLDVIDFKTDAPPDGPAERAYPEYVAQVCTYARLLVVVIVLLTLAVDGSSRNSGSSNDARVLFSDSVFSWSSATSVVPQVIGQATGHPETNTWTYTYVLKNDASSTSAIMTFALAPVLAPQSIGRPIHWMQTYGFGDRSDAAVWRVVDAGPPPTGWDSVSVYPSPFELQPGDTLAGFSIVSPNGPGMINYYVEGFHGLALEPDEPDPPALFDNSITGSVVGPVSVTGVTEDPSRSGSVEFRAPAPNPARGAVALTFYLPAPAQVVLAAYDVAGRRTRALIEGKLPAGVHSSSWNGLDDSGRRVPAGVYFYKLTVDGKAVSSRRVVVIP